MAEGDYRRVSRRRVYLPMLAVIAVLGLAAIVTGWFAWGRGDGAVSEPLPDFATLRLADTPNQYLILPARFEARATPHAVSPVFDVPVGRLERTALEIIREQPRTVAVASEPARRSYAFVQRTLLLRFPDTVTVRFVELDDRTSALAIYSRSKIGRSDFGANRKRVEDWLAAIRDRLSR